MAKRTTLERLIDLATNMVKVGDERIAEFTKSFAADPAYALSWADRVYEATAEREVGKAILLWIENAKKGEPKSDDITAGFVMTEVSRNVVRAAKNPARSTSPSSNLMADAMGSAWADVLDRMEF